MESAMLSVVAHKFCLSSSISAFLYASETWTYASCSVSCVIAVCSLLLWLLSTERQSVQTHPIWSITSGNTSKTSLDSPQHSVVWLFTDVAIYAIIHRIKTGNATVVIRISWHSFAVIFIINFIISFLLKIYTQLSHVFWALALSCFDNLSLFTRYLIYKTHCVIKWIWCAILKILKNKL